ncbi:g-type lectin s-receptor-like serine/threonine-protein kinase ces101 [Quercus suber]|uniref:G-type lectin s-receptor-like serine/threonine-protein kinase ces101 n=1 Tax=Quercus suber TaxID=58331 RepID=A0AAW0KZ91_QUESU
MNKDPKPGNEFVILWHGEAYWTGGFSNEKGYQSWPTNGFTLPDQRGVYYSFVKITNENETYFNYSSNDAIFPRLRINHLGNLYLCERLLVECSTLSPASSGGFVKQTLPECRRHDYTFIKDSAYIVDGDVFEFNESDNLTRVDCQNRCLNNCSCVAYASSKQDDIGCKIWTRVPSIEWCENAQTIYFLEYKGIVHNSKHSCTVDEFCQLSMFWDGFPLLPLELSSSTVAMLPLLLLHEA